MVKSQGTHKIHMALIQVKPPIPAEPLTLLWDDGKIRAKGGEVALAHWRDLQAQGLYGRYGHIVNPDNVSVIDLYSALVNRVGSKNLKMDDDARAEYKKGAKDKAPSNELT